MRNIVTMGWLAEKIGDPQHGYCGLSIHIRSIGCRSNRL